MGLIEQFQRMPAVGEIEELARLVCLLSGSLLLDIYLEFYKLTEENSS